MTLSRLNQDLTADQLYPDLVRIIHWYSIPHLQAQTFAEAMRHLGFRRNQRAGGMLGAIEIPEPGDTEGNLRRIPIVITGVGSSYSVRDLCILEGNCAIRLRELATASVDLIVTSPPYADQRRRAYGGIHPDKYVDWFMPIANQLHRVLKPTGSFILNIKEGVVAAERSTYVLELILAMRKSGWLWTEEYIWHKKNAVPGKWPNRFRDAWERCLHFTKQTKFQMYQDAVMVPVGDWVDDRLTKLSKTDIIRTPSRTGSNFARNISNWLGRDLVYPTNVLYAATECGSPDHSAPFPEDLPEFFIKLFSAEGDLVLDPFLGSGTTLRVAGRLNRRGIGIEIVPAHCEQARRELGLRQAA
jgi:site-specific DNA-methyltransferase (adenine-specific)